MPTIDIPELGELELPDGLSPEQINAVAGHVYAQQVRLPQLRKKFSPEFETSESDLATLEAHEEQERLADAFQKPGFLGQLWHDVMTRPVADFTKSASIGKALQYMSGRKGVVMEDDDWPVWRQAQLGKVDRMIFPKGLSPGSFSRHESFQDPLNPNQPAVESKLKDYYDMYIKGTPRQTIGVSDKDMMDILNAVPSSPTPERIEPGTGAMAVVGGGVEGVENFVLSTIGFLTSPVGLTTMGAAPGLRAAAQRGSRTASATQAGLALGFAALMGKELPAQWDQMRQAIKEGDKATAVRIGTEGALTLLASGAAGIHGLVEGYKTVRPSGPGRPAAPAATPTTPVTTPLPKDEVPLAPLDPSLAPVTIPVEPRTPPGGPILGQIGMALREQAEREQKNRAAQLVPAPTKREAQLAEPTIIGQRPVTIVQDLILPERFMEAEANRDRLVAERDRLSNAFSVAARNGDMTGMTDAARAIEEINTRLNENRNVRESLGVDLEGQLEGTYPPTAEQLGTFQSRAVVPELSDVTKRPADVGSLPSALRPKSTRMGSVVRPVEGQVYPEPPVGVVPPESLKAELPLQPDTFPTPRPPKLREVPESERGSGIISGTDLERWADKVIGEDPRVKTRMGDPLDVRRLAAMAVKGAAVIERGIRDFAAWSAEMVRAHGPGITPILPDLFKRSQAYLEQKQARATPSEPTPTKVAEKPVTELVKEVTAIPNEQLAAHPGGMTQFMWDLGAKARTPEDVAALRTMAEQSKAEFKRLMEAGDMDGAMRVAGRQPAEAYEYATGVNLEGKPKWKVFEDMAARRGQTYKPSVPDQAYTKAKSESPTPPAPAPKAAKPAGSEKPRERDKPMYTDDRSKQELNKAGLEVVKSEEGRAKYTPAVMAKNGDLFTGATHDEALSNLDAAGKELASRNSVGYVSKDNPEHFLNLEGIAKEERRLEQQRKAGETDAVQGKTTAVPPDVQAQPGEGTRQVPTAERPPTDAPPPTQGGQPPSGGAARPVEPTTPRGGVPGETTPQTQGQEVLGQKPKRPLGEIYSEPFAERIRRLGGPVADRVAKDTQRIVDNAKRMYGELSSNILDRAKRMSGKAFRGGSTWFNGKTNINPRAAVGRMFTVLETYNQTGNWNHVPAAARPLAQALYDANLAIGNLRNSGANPVGQPHDVMRLVTPWGVDVIRRGTGRAWNALIDGYSQANGEPRATTEAFFRNWKAELDKPVPSASKLDQISKDFVSQYPKAVTHLRPILGWHEFLQAAPFHYLEQSGQRVANTVAFQQVYPPGTGALNRTREAVQAEVKTDSGMAEFDNMTRALRGYPTDVAANWYNAPDTLVGALSRAGGMVLRPLKSGLLTQSLGTNVGETLAGGVGIFLGYGRMLRSLYQSGRLRAQMIRSGQINRAIRDFSFDPTKPLQSLSKYASNLISRAFLNDFMNEVQEFSAASAARTVANEIRTGNLPAGDVRLVQNTMRMMGFTKQQAIDAVAGRNPDVVNQFETKAAEALTSGNQILAEKSRLGSSRTFNQLFWFQSYPMLKVRQARSILNNVIEDAHQGDWRGAASNTALLAKFTAGTAMSGAITAGLLATLKEGLYGAGIRKQEAQDDFGKFVLNSFLMGMGGPLSTFSKVMEESGSIPQFTQNLEQAAKESISPYGLYKQIERAGAGTGEYEGLDTFERVGKFLESKTPGLKPFKAAMAASGLSQDNAKLDAAISAYYRWARREIGIDKTEIQRKNDDRKDVRAYAKRVVNAVKDGKDFGEDLVKSIVAAAGTKTDNPYDSAARSIRGKQVIGGRLSPDEEAALRKHIGDDPVNRIKAHDMMLDKIADHVAGLEK